MMPGCDGVEVARHPLVSVSLGVATGSGDHRDVVAAAAEMKSVAKARTGSAYAVDRRA